MYLNSEHFYSNTTWQAPGDQTAVMGVVVGSRTGHEQLMSAGLSGCEQLGALDP